MARKKVERKVTEDPRYHNTWKLLKKCRDVVWSLELSVQQVKNVEEIIEQLRPHIHDISFRTYYRRRKETIEVFGSVTQ